jgi:hypothetical protein
MAAAAGRPESSTSRILVIFGIIVLGTLAWFIAPMFLPIWRWRNIDFHQIALDKKVDEKLLRQEFDVIMRYEPREKREDDPTPYQIIQMTPDWQSLDPEKRENENHLLVRAYVMSDKNGRPPSGLYVGNTFRDRYFKAKCWRFPPGCFGLPPYRPIIVFRALSFDKITIGEADMYETEMRRSQTWENDDHWEERDDGYDPAAIDAQKKEAEEKAAEGADAAPK